MPWDVEQPNAGFMLLDERRESSAPTSPSTPSATIDGAPRALLQPRRLVRAARSTASTACACSRRCSAQDGYHFTDLSPSGNVVALNERLSFRFLDTTTALVPNLPWPSRPGRDSDQLRPGA